MVITIKQSPRGTFYRAEQGSLCTFDRDRKVAIRKLAEAIWGIKAQPVRQGAA